MYAAATSQLGAREVRRPGEPAALFAHAPAAAVAAAAAYARMASLHPPCLVSPTAALLSGFFSTSPNAASPPRPPVLEAALFRVRREGRENAAAWLGEPRNTANLPAACARPLAEGNKERATQSRESLSTVPRPARAGGRRAQQPCPAPSAGPPNAGGGVASGGASGRTLRRLGVEWGGKDKEDGIRRLPPFLSHEHAPPPTRCAFALTRSSGSRPYAGPGVRGRYVGQRALRAEARDVQTLPKNLPAELKPARLTATGFKLKRYLQQKISYQSLHNDNIERTKMLK
eukprot:258763-Chlamydomonas_euryale.AAC.5